MAKPTPVNHAHLQSVDNPTAAYPRSALGDLASQFDPSEEPTPEITSEGPLGGLAAPENSPKLLMIAALVIGGLLAMVIVLGAGLVLLLTG